MVSKWSIMIRSMSGTSSGGNSSRSSSARRRHIRATIPIPEDQADHRRRRGARGGRPYAFDAEAYKGRNVVERTFNKLKDHQAFAMRTDKRGYIFTGTVTVAALRTWLRDLTRQDPSDTP